MWGRVCHWHVVGVEFRDADKQPAMHGTGRRREFIIPNSAEVGAPALPSVGTARAVLTVKHRSFCVCVFRRLLHSRFFLLLAVRSCSPGVGQWERPLQVLLDWGGACL